MALDYTVALKKVSGPKKTSANFMVLEFAYNNKIVLPHEDGVTVLAALAQAEVLKAGYGEKPQINGPTRDMVTTSMMSQDEYRSYKIAMLLNCTLDEVQQYALAAEETA